MRKKVAIGQESLMQVISILGNTLVLWTVLAHRRMWSLTNYFLVNLAIADLGMAVFNCIPGWVDKRNLMLVDLV